jgi:hypothetical protein
MLLSQIPKVRPIPVLRKPVVVIVSRETERIAFFEESMNRMENMITKSFHMQEQQQAKISGNLATPQQGMSGSARVPRQVTTKRLSVQDRLVDEEESEDGGHRTSSYPGIRDVHRRNSPMDYFDYSSENIMYPRRNLMNEEELPSRQFGNLEEYFIVPPYHSSGGDSSLKKTQMIQTVLQAHLVLMVVVDVQVEAFIRMMNTQRYLYTEC